MKASRIRWLLKGRALIIAPNRRASRKSRRRLLDHEMNRNASARQHRDQCIQAEQINFPPDQVADPRLSNPEELGGAILCEVAPADDLLNLNDQLRTKGEV